MSGPIAETQPARADDPAKTAAPGYFDFRVFAGEGTVRLHAIVKGDEGKRAVVLLHGFPDFSLTWRHVLDDLDRAGYYAVALDLRGAGGSSIPTEPEAYHLDRHVADLDSVLDKLTAETDGPRKTPHVVAHDFGASVAWLAAMRRPRTLASLAVLNGVHPAHVRTVGLSPSRMLALGHVGVLQVPGLAETVLTPAALTNVLSTLIRRGQFTAQDVVRYRTAFARPGVRRAMFAWYRQLARANVCTPRLKPLPIEGLPVLTILGRRDPFLDRALVAPPPSWVVDPPPINVELKGGHWVHWDNPRETTERLREHLERAA
jgi:pimeloyl-ACP methyl ester carboxylesterase